MYGRLGHPLYGEVSLCLVRGGEVAEWTKATVCYTAAPIGVKGSNPFLSAVLAHSNWTSGMFRWRVQGNTPALAHVEYIYQLYWRTTSQCGIHLSTVLAHSNWTSHTPALAHWRISCRRAHVPHHGGGR